MRKLFFFFLISCLGLSAWGQVTRSFEFETSEVTQPGLSGMPQGKSFIFNLLGHLFELPAAGGEATQLTFGPYYDSEPVVSPDGKKMAFISNRDGSDGNLFIMDIASKKIVKITNEFMVETPAWNTEGTALAYLSFLRREEYPVDKIPFFGAGDRASVCTISATGANRQQVTDAGNYVMVFYQSDGSLAWARTERKGPSGYAGPGMPPPAVTTWFEKKNKDGNIVRTGSLKDRTGHVAFTKLNNSFYYVSGKQLRHYTAGDTTFQTITPFAGAGAALALSPDEKMIYAASDAAFWKIDLSTLTVSKITWKAKVKMEVAKPAINQWKIPASDPVALSSVLTPRLSPDGKKWVFTAAGFLWEQPTGGEAKRLIDEDSYQIDPSFSPDGSRLVFASDKQGKREIRIFDFATRQTQSIASVGGYSWLLQPVWSPDGKTILFQRSDALGYPYTFIRANAATGETAVVATSENNWNGRPHFSSDGNAIYYTARPGMFANVFKLSLQPGSTPEAITHLKRHAHDALVSPDGQWVAFRRNAEIWIAPIKQQPVADENFRLFSKTGGRSFAFTPDGSAILYSDGNKIVKQTITDQRITSFPVQLKLETPVSAPVLISRVHVLSFQTGKFSGETSLYIEGNRIVWIGDEKEKTISPKALRIDGQGKFAIPGLMDSHTHAAWTNQQITEDRLIAYGVTSVRDVGSRLDVINTLRDKGEATHLPVPRYFAAGDIYEGLVPLWGDAFFEINSKQEAIDYVKYSKANGASFIKVYASLPWFVKSEVAAEANRQGLPVVGHGISLEEITRSINFGITSLEHAGPANDDVIKLMAHAGTWFDPTPGIFGAGTTLKLADTATLNKKFRTFIPEEELKAARPGRIPSAAQLATWKNTLTTLKHIHDSGVNMLDGTDALMTGVFHGPSVHWVLQFFSDAGIPAIEVLKIGTLHAAESVGAAKDLGSLESGKLADLVLLNADPLQDIKNTLKIWRVIKGGIVFDPETMRTK
ncbi:MAG: PD40 domain-containing protein [Bacteroidetes bacterium]|nr:PD40 domain-containing protein [Bacteroidota bacterium]